MSRSYGMNVEIKGFDLEKEREVIDAANKLWSFDDWSVYRISSSALESYGEGSLSGGEDEHGFALRLAGAIWAANKAFCEVNVQATYLEACPYETYDLDQEDYEVWRKSPFPKT